VLICPSLSASAPIEILQALDVAGRRCATARTLRIPDRSNDLDQSRDHATLMTNREIVTASPAKNKEAVAGLGDGHLFYAPSADFGVSFAVERGGLTGSVVSSPGAPKFEKKAVRQRSSPTGGLRWFPEPRF
jgi:hypothetical protein